jgi:uncharacterized protein (TIGR02246 family)
MTQRSVRLAAIGISFATFLVFVGCQSNGGNVNTAANSNSRTNLTSTNTTPNSTQDDQHEISTLLDKYNDALLKKDADALDRIWSDDLSFVNLRGQLLTKKDRIDNIKTGSTALKSADVSEKSIRMYGDTAVATLVVKIEGQYSGQEGSGSFRVTTVWAKRKGTWQMVAVQMTPIAK